MTLEKVREELMIWYEARLNVATLGKSYRINDRQYTAADLPEINRMIRHLEDEVTRLATGVRRSRTRGIVMRDL